MSRPDFGILARLQASQRRRLDSAREKRPGRLAGRARVHRLARLDSDDQALTRCGLRLDQAQARLDRGAVSAGRPCRNCDRSERSTP